ncbi:hypothetical protein V1478_009037 [Vespula squamosa]|uniref:Uncharacterized protein n=1 Tax=Vespula squamosa TaxID=30214 RepID=A0ABD2AV83_VESSQ
MLKVDTFYFSRILSEGTCVSHATSFYKAQAITYLSIHILCYSSIHFSNEFIFKNLTASTAYIYVCTINQIYDPRNRTRTSTLHVRRVYGIIMVKNSISL